MARVRLKVAAGPTRRRKVRGRVSKDMTIDKVLQLEPVKAAASAL